MAALAFASGCSNDKSDTASTETRPVLTAATLGEQRMLTRDEYLSASPYSDADAARGERLAAQCRACHTLNAGGATMIGPNLYGFFGQRAGASDDRFAYSQALAEADFIWTPRALDAWLAEPARFLPGNRMSYAGLRDEDDRNDLIAWLLAEVSNDPGE
ncbi:MAG: c-type cytochrome [Woeseiaceae bacterium]|nr:c-type cytochrome [Woeseiaceae bacterium]